MNSVQEKAIQQEAADAARSGNASRLRDCLTRGANLWYACVFGFALESGDVTTFQTTLDFGADISEDMGHNGTPLIAALRYNHHELLEFLFSKGVDPNKRHWGHWLPPLSVAVRFTKDIKWVQRLLEAGAKVKGSGALRFAAFQSDLAMMKILLDYGADVNEIPPFPLYGAKPSIIHTKKGTPVHWAIAGEHLGAVRLLCRYEPDLTIQDEDGATVMDCLDSFIAKLAAA
ncbi:isoform 2 of ankyrin repeat and SOCS box protein 2 [Aspergillus udagawae]|nr:isoform 2 of ankyrin repeat and SOCS box protein 2 [Aspergillus udagawae]